MAFSFLTSNTRWLRYILTLLPLLLMMHHGTAQIAGNLIVGEPVRLGVKPAPGIFYSWKVMEIWDLKKGTETNRAIWHSGRDIPEVTLSFQNAGTYMIAVTASDQNGCANSKVFPVLVAENHPPVAVDDYISTDWLQSIRIDLLKNDHDAGNDLDTSSLKIVKEPSHGSISTVQKGVAIYLATAHGPVRDEFYYMICDSGNQCDTARVSVSMKDQLLEFPQMISPNGDGINDQFVIKGLSVYPGSTLTIFSRHGEIVYHSENYQNDWAGTRVKGTMADCQVPSGTYYYLFHPGGTARILKGFLYIAR